MIEEIKKKLLSKKVADRKKAAKEIREQRLTEFSELLFKALVKEIEGGRSWETIAELILAIGAINYKQALPIIKKIIEENKPHDMITYAAAQTYVRLVRTSTEDATPIIELLKFGGLSVVDGALNPLAYDKMMPPSSQIKLLIYLSWNLQNHPDRIGFEYAYSDPRYGLAAACARWDKQLVTPFLKHCLLTANKDSSLIYVAKMSLEGKYPKLR